MTHRHGVTQALALAASIAMLCLPAQPQTAQKGVDANANARGRECLRIDYVGYRAARWETEHVTEVEIYRPNQGGLIHVYYTNVSDQPLRLAFWRANRKDESYGRLGGSLAWERTYDYHIEPGQIRVELGDIEVCKLVVLANDAELEDAYRGLYVEVVEDEQREF